MSPPDGDVSRWHAKPLSLLSRIGQVLGMLAVLAAILTILYLRHTGWDHPLAKLFGAYKHKVATLSEYVEYKRDANRFYDQHGAAKLSFDCERIRDDFVKMNHERVARMRRQFWRSRRGPRPGRSIPPLGCLARRHYPQHR